MNPNPAELIEKMRAQRGGRLHRIFEYLGSIDSEFLEAYNDLAILNFNYAEAAAGRALDAKVKELIAVALLAAVRGNTTRHHLRRALELGATRREIVEALEMAMHITGAPSLEFGLAELMALDSDK
jgi:alkylhydroperoxidase/carboxymuconolactone decarboxylase family protein YurZ